MKTVKDYLDLGLVFVTGDIVDDDGENDGTKMKPLPYWMVEHCNAGQYEYGNAKVESFAWRNNDGVKPEYKGPVKVELNSGDVIFNCGKTSEFDWRINDNVNPKILRWKPIVISDGIAGRGYRFAINECQKPSLLQDKPKINLIVPDSLKAEVRRVGSEINVTISQKDKQENDANKKIREKFISALRTDSKAKNVWNAIKEQFCLPVGIDSPELREAFKSLNEYMESKPNFTIKEEAPSSTMTVNIEGRDYLIPSRTPTVSPKEDKPMKLSDEASKLMEDFHNGNLDMKISDGKPVYTVEMNAKNELPPVGSEVKVCIEEAGFELDGNDSKFEGKTVTVKSSFINKDENKIAAIENDKGNCACYIIECIKPIIKTIKVNGFDVPAPMSEAPDIGSVYFTASINQETFFCTLTWENASYDNRALSRGFVHSAKSAAIAHAKAMLGIDPNA